MIIGNGGYARLLLFESHVATVITLEDSQARSTDASVMYECSALPADTELVCLLFPVVTRGNGPANNKQLQTA